MLRQFGSCTFFPHKLHIAVMSDTLLDVVVPFLPRTNKLLFVIVNLLSHLLLLLVQHIGLLALHQV